MAESSFRKIIKSKYALGIYALCSGVLMIFCLSVLQVLNNAGNIANEVQLKAEQNLVRNEINRQIEIVAFDQSQISHWDNAVTALTHDLDKEFIQEEIADWLWSDFGIRNTLVIGSDGKPRVAVLEDRIFSPKAGFEVAEANRDLIEQAQAKYMENRIARGDGYFVPGDPIRSHNPIYVADFRTIRNQLGILVAQAIIPDYEEILPTGKAQILLVFKPVSESMFEYMGSKLGLKNFYIATNTRLPEGYNSVRIGSSDSKSIRHAVWQPATPSNVIWSQSALIISGLFLLVGFALFFTSIRYSKALASLQESEEKNRFLALHDPLTGLPNRLQFDRQLDEIITEKQQDSCAVLCADLDRFKKVNDTYGHQAGDAVIKTIADRIAQAVGDKGMAARIGGDEFIILLKGQLDRDMVLFLCDNIIEKACEEVFFEGGSAFVGMSIGVAWWPDDALTAKNIIRSADEALYRAKEAGRGQACTSGKESKAA